MLNRQKNTNLFSLGFQPGIKPVFFIFLIIFFHFSHLHTQENLVPNGDFEEYMTCPDINPPYYFVDRATHWFMPSTGSSDYFNACSDYFDVTINSLLFSVPQNSMGYQEARSGVAYGGYYAALTPKNDNYFEYLSVKLTNPLKRNKLYCLTYYLSLGDSTFKKTSGQYLQIVNHSGAYFSNDLEISSDYTRIIASPQVYNPPDIMLNDSTGWQKVEGIFIAEGNEQFLTIGYFFDYNQINFNYASATDSAVTAYYFIDDISLIELDFNFPNVFTPNSDGFNDIAFKDETLLGLKIEIINRWGNIVSITNFSKGWDGIDDNGQPCLDGVYFYVIKRDEEIIKTGFIQLIR